MPIWTQEIPHRRKQRTSVVPKGKSFDLWSLLEEHDKVRLMTCDGNFVTLTKMSKTTLLPHRGLITGLDIAVESFGMKMSFDGWCRRECTIWKQVDLSRIGLYWRFGRVERETTPVHLGWGVVQVRHVSPQS